MCSMDRRTRPTLSCFTGQGFVDQLLSDIKAAFPIEQIMTPTEHVLRLNSTWQSIDEMSAAGKRVLFVSASDYGEAMFPLIFSRQAHLMCATVLPSSVMHALGWSNNFACCLMEPRFIFCHVTFQNCVAGHASREDPCLACCTWIMSGLSLMRPASALFMDLHGRHAGALLGVDHQLLLLQE